MAYRIAFIGIALCCAVAGAGCPGGYCTLKDCAGSLDIVISHGDGGDLEDGSYVVEIDAGGEAPETVTCVVGEESCHSDPSGIATGDFIEGAIVVSFFFYDDEPPATIGVSVSFDGEPVGSEPFTPSWSLDYPNGEDCEPACWIADDEEMEIDRPAAAD